MNACDTKTLPDFSVLQEIVYRLWEIIQHEMFSDLNISEKNGKELVTRIDTMIEERARRMIKQHIWNVNFLWEEYWYEDNWSEITCIIDPLDGTESFINREFNTSISIAVEYNGELVYGVVYDFMKDILYTSDDHCSLYLHKKPLQKLTRWFSQQVRVLISGRWTGVYKAKRQLRKIPNIQITHSYGSIALQAAQTLSWNYDGYVRTWKTKTWDIAWAAACIGKKNDVSIYSRDGSQFDHHLPEAWLIIVNNVFKDQLFTTLQL